MGNCRDLFSNGFGPSFILDRVEAVPVQPTKIGINTLFLVPGDVGGTETYLRESLLAAVREYPEVEFVLFTNNENDALFRTLCAEHDNVCYVCLNFNATNRPLRIIFEQVKLPFAVRKHRVGLLWSPGYTTPFFTTCPQVVTVCDLQYKSHPEDMSALERIILDLLVRGACRRCEAVLAISEFSRREILSYGFARPEDVHAVLLGVDEAFAHHQSGEKRKKRIQELLPSPATPFILCVAHTYPHKKVHVLVDAFKQIMEMIPHNLVLVGRARRGEERVVQSVEAVKDCRRIIRFKDGLPQGDLQLLFQSADMFVLPSVYEGFGLPVLEAMMAGTPVITTSEASLPEVAGEHAYRVAENTASALAEQILRLHALPAQERSRLTEDAQTWAKTFTWKKSVQQMFQVFFSVAKQNDS